MGKDNVKIGDKMLSKIFSITEYNDTHNLIIFFGIKIKLPKKEVKERFKTLPYESYKKNKVNITELPPATGVFRDIQLANLALLLELDHVCKGNKLKYWIDFGTLLGAVRHKGFIPWDDDIDVGMLRQDYNKFVELFNQTTQDSDIYADYTSCSGDSSQIIIKIKHKKCPHLFVDIFPYDNYPNPLNKEEQVKITNKIKKLRDLFKKDFNKNITIQDFKENVIKYTKLIVKNESLTPCNYFWGIDYNHHWKNWFADEKVLFPLNIIEFEKILLPCINQKEEYLHKVYGNYLKYPKKFGYGHNMFVKLNKNEEKIVKELRNKYEKSLNLRNV